MEEKPINWGDQIAHVAIGFFCSFPILGGFFSVLAREYYQRKRVMEAVIGRQPGFWEVLDPDPEVGEGFDFFKRDLVFSYIGIAASITVMVIYFWKYCA
jgi:hypothetical protein